MEIKITCKGQKYVHIDSLKGFQGNLKEIQLTELEKLQRSIIKHGFSFPVFVCDGQILDGHQRVFATRELIKEGYSIPDIPVVEIEAENRRDAAEKLLMLNNRYAQISEVGLETFIINNEINFEEIESELILPGVNFDLLFKDDFEPVEEDEQPALDEKKKVKCPSCGVEF